MPGTAGRITFRLPREEDYLGSYLRRHVFQHLPQRELGFDVILGLANEDYDPEAKTLLTDDSNPLSEWQDKDAVHHWQRESIDSTSISLSAPASTPRKSVTLPVGQLPPPRSSLNREFGGCTSFNFASFASSVSDTHSLTIETLNCQ